MLEGVINLFVTVQINHFKLEKCLFLALLVLLGVKINILYLGKYPLPYEEGFRNLYHYVDRFSLKS